MISLVNVAIFSGSVVIFLLRGYRKGIWLSITGLVGLLFAYGLSFTFAPELMAAARRLRLQSMGLESTLAALVAMSVFVLGIFIVVSLCFAYLPGRFFPAIKNVQPWQRQVGAVFGGLSGVIVGMLLVWAVNILAASLMRSHPLEGRHAEPSPLAQLATKIVAGAVRTGIGILEDDPFKASVAAAMVSSPQSFAASFKQLSAAPQLRDFWQDGETQFYMDQGELDALMAHRKFQALINTQQLKDLLDGSRPAEISEDEAQRYVARQLSFVFRRMRLLRSDPRVVAILEDPEFISLTKERNPIALLANDKVQALITLVMEDGVSQKTLEALARPGELSIKPSPVASQAPKLIYRWMDDNGKMRYTNEADTPPSRRDSAEIITY